MAWRKAFRADGETGSVFSVMHEEGAGTSPWSLFLGFFRRNWESVLRFFNRLLRRFCRLVDKGVETEGPSGFVLTAFDRVGNIRTPGR